MRIGFAGTPAPAVVTLEALLATHHDISLVITRTDAPVGRGKVMTPSPVAHSADLAGLRVVKRDSLRDCGDLFAGLDAVVVVAYGALVPPAQLDVPTHGFLNVHYSLLPRWRGAAPVQRAIAAGDEHTGVTVFRLDAGLDTGPIFAARGKALNGTETAESLLEDLAHVGSEVLIEVLASLESGQGRATAQSSSGATYAPKIATHDARIDWTTSAVDIDRHVRAMTPHPGAWSMCDDERIKFEPVTVVPECELAPGVVQRVSGRIVVGTGRGGVALSRVQRAGRTMVDADAWFAAGVVLT